MASNDRKSSDGDSDRVQEDQETSSMEAHDRVLLKALQDFVVPIIRTLDQTIQINDNEIPLGPEAGRLISALHEFISSIIVRSQSKAQNVITVSLDEEEKDSAGDLNDVGEKHESSSEVGVIPHGSPSHKTDAQNEDIILDSERAGPTFHDKLLSALREHVFNIMPIRLLCFEPRGSSLQITLVERDTIHRRLESMLRANMRQPDLIQNIIDMGSDTPMTKAEREDNAIQQLISQYARYAILSHTWLRTSREVTYSDWNTGDFDAEGPGYRKLVNFCKVVWKDHGLAYGWMDTICINKESSSELDESIRSMYNWYNRADICVIYLGETTSLSDMHIDPWFTRGWTLQELIAPDVLKFYNGAWQQLVAHSENDKTDADTLAQIERATTISPAELYSIRHAPLSRRMQMAARRKVTREEDTAYSLMGLFDVSFATAYGEGAPRAFFRLLQEVLASPTYHILDLFNWAGTLPLTLLHKSRVLPSSPACFLRRSVLSGGFLLGQPIGPLTLTHLGLRVPVVLMPAMSIIGTVSQYDPIGDYKATVDITRVGYHTDSEDVLTGTNIYNLLDNRISGRDGWSEKRTRNQLTLAVVNFKGDASSIFIPKTCFALVLTCSEDAGKVTELGHTVVVNTDVPTVFDLRKEIKFTADEADLKLSSYYMVKREELGRHGMQLLNLYL